MAPNNKRYQDMFAEVRIEASQWAESAARLLISADRKAEARSFIDEALRFDPDNIGATKLLEQLGGANPRLGKLNAVQTVYVDEIKGEIGGRTREQIKVLLVNTGRFQVLGEENKSNADATIGGHAELRELAVTTTSSGTTKGNTNGGLITSAIIGRHEKSTTSVERTTSESVVLSLTNKVGEVIWGWDGTKACTAAAKAKCAVDDLVNAARR
jgi:hypothetical protein